MKKLFLLFLLLFLPSFAYEEIPLLINTSAINVNTTKEDEAIINVENMKKSASVEKAKNNLKETKSKIKIDTQQIHHQKTLDYMYGRGSGTMLPIF